MENIEKDLAVAQRSRLALVTGASRGIGRAIALALAQAGYHIVAAARTIGALEELDDDIKALGGSTTIVPLDLKEPLAIDRLGNQLRERWGYLDVFVGNAGILGPLSPLAHVPFKDWQEVLAVNLTANWYLLRALDPLLRVSRAGRAIFISSTRARTPKAYWGPYAVSKAALEVMVQTYAEETATTPIKVIIANPGATRTAMRAQAMPGEDPQTLATPEAFAAALLPFLDENWTESGCLFDFPTRRLILRQ